MEKQPKKITLIQWLIKLIDTPAWRVGKVTGYKHPQITQEVIHQIGKRELLDQAAELEAAGLIQVKWREFKNDIEKLDVPVDIMDDLCQRANVENPRKQLEHAKKEVLMWKTSVKNDWCVDYYDDLLKKMEHGEIPGEVHDPKLFQLLNAIPGDNTAVWKRIFSSGVVGESKAFENKYEKRILTIIRKYAPNIDEEMDDQEVLAEFGILSYSQTLEWKGTLKYQLGDFCEVDTSGQVYGTVLGAQTLSCSRPVDLFDVKKIITIENKAIYEDATYSQDVLYIYSHGFFSPKERRFLEKLYLLADERVEFYHWGDMDYGGIRIYQFIKANLFSTLQPMNMDSAAFKSAIAAGAGIELPTDKRAKLEKLDAGDLEELKKCILKTGIEIEQEALLVKDFISGKA